MSEALAALVAAVRTAFPGIDAPRLVQYRVIRDVEGRLSLQAVNAADDAPGQNNDMRPVEVWPGIPGATSTPTPGEIVLVAFAGRDQYPMTVARSPDGPLPQEVRLDATSELRLLGALGSAGAVAKVGAGPTFPLARAVDVAAFLAAVKTFAAAAKASTDPTLAATATALETALLSVTINPTTKLEAQ